MQNKAGKNTIKEKTLYHATSPKNAMKIARSNIDWRKTKTSRFGKGSYFSDNPKYAHRHANKCGGIFLFYFCIFMWASNTILLNVILFVRFIQYRILHFGSLLRIRLNNCNFIFCCLSVCVSCVLLIAFVLV